MGKKKAVPDVPKRVQAAVEYLFDNAKADLADAAKHAGISTYKLRSSMMQPHVSKWVWNQKRARLEALCVQNPAALREVRDTSDNGVAVVNAVKTLEALRQDVVEVVGATYRPAPGLLIQIIQAPGVPMRTIGPTPEPVLIEARPVADEPVER
jgi:hypothetical protein